MLDRKNFSVFTKNKETFKFIHNLLDTQILQMEKNCLKREEKRGAISRV